MSSTTPETPETSGAPKDAVIPPPENNSDANANAQPQQQTTVEGVDAESSLTGAPLSGGKRRRMRKSKKARKSVRKSGRKSAGRKASRKSARKSQKARRRRR